MTLLQPAPLLKKPPTRRGCHGTSPPIVSCDSSARVQFTEHIRRGARASFGLTTYKQITSTQRSHSFAMTKSLIRTASLAVLGPLALYTVFWSLAVIPFFQRQYVASSHEPGNISALANLPASFLYAHKINTLFWHDLNKPEYWGFASQSHAHFSPLTICTSC